MFEHHANALPNPGFEIPHQNGQLPATIIHHVATVAGAAMESSIHCRAGSFRDRSVTERQRRCWDCQCQEE
jgi:hypothetical protein